MSKITMANSGTPLFVNPEMDLLAKPGAVLDSWYVNCNFDCEGKQVGFVWHQMTNTAPLHNKTVNVEFLLMEVTEKIWVDHAVTLRVSKETGASDKELYVHSPFGYLSGDRRTFMLQLAAEDNKIDVVLRPKEQVLYNGTVGLLGLGPLNSYQFAFPNMDIEGAVTIKGRQYPVNNTTAWFDRQWGSLGKDVMVKWVKKILLEGRKSLESEVAWLWLGMTLGKDASEAISLWDFYYPGKRHGFATILMKDGNQMNVIADVSYDKIWTSNRSGYQYPRQVHITIPKIDLDITLTALLDEPEFVRGKGEATGCQSLSLVRGSYKGAPIHRQVVLEMIGNLCGG